VEKTCDTSRNKALYITNKEKASESVKSGRVAGTNKGRAKKRASGNNRGTNGSW